MKNRNLFYLVTPAIAGFAIVISTPSSALEIEVGESDLDLSGEEATEVQPQVSTDGENVNFEVYERPEPETEIIIRDGLINVEREQEPSEQIIDLSVPVE